MYAHTYEYAYTCAHAYTRTTIDHGNVRLKIASARRPSTQVRPDPLMKSLVTALLAAADVCRNAHFGRSIQEGSRSGAAAGTSGQPGARPEQMPSRELSPVEAVRHCNTFDSPLMISSCASPCIFAPSDYPIKHLSVCVIKCTYTRSRASHNPTNLAPSI